MAVGTLFVFRQALDTGDSAYAGTMAFTTLVIFQLYNVLNSKSDTSSVFSARLFSNIWLWLAIISSFALQLIAIYSPLSYYLKTVPLSISDWAIIMAVGSTVVIFEEVKKFIARRAYG
jgi:P-type Ca2+ transporter type 2C